jgi:heme exporter protein D
MNWQSLDEFLHMGGYGLYVWGSYGVTLAVMLAEVVLLRRRRAAAFDAARTQTAQESAR